MFLHNKYEHSKTLGCTLIGLFRTKLLPAKVYRLGQGGLYLLVTMEIHWKMEKKNHNNY